MIPWFTTQQHTNLAKITTACIIFIVYAYKSWSGSDIFEKYAQVIKTKVT